MSTLTAQYVAEVIRQRMGAEDGSSAARIINGIPLALKTLGRRVAADDRLRPLLETDPATTTVAYSSGSYPLATMLGTNHILEEYLHKGRIYHPDWANYPLVRITPAEAKLPKRFSEYGYYYIQGQKIYVVSYVPVSVSSGSISLAVPYYPMTLTQVPDADELHRIFLDALYEQLMGGASE